jgi:hypothetical protein
VDNNKQTASVLDTIKLPTCTHMDLRQNVTLRGGIKSGNFTKLGEVADMQTCIDACCQDLKCDVAFMAETTCYSLRCFTERLCETVPAKPRRTKKNVQISHIVRGGGRGDDLETFSQQQGIEKYGEWFMDAVCFSLVLISLTITLNCGHWSSKSTNRNQIMHTQSPELMSNQI